jgi:hypothetical protein
MKYSTKREKKIGKQNIKLEIYTTIEMQRPKMKEGCGLWRGC